ncbi:MAG: Flp family type IVb pilin [Thermodesulfovibrionales bacterium]|jgi:pilus assembly protein Flp/PilA
MMCKAMAWWHVQRDRLSSEEGSGAVEYALITGLIAVVIIVAVGALGTRVSDVFFDITNALG